jgi:hypothetical protein
VELFGPEQPNPPGLQVVEQGQLDVLPLGPLFDESQNQGPDMGSRGEHEQKFLDEPALCRSTSIHSLVLNLERAARNSS